MQNAEGVYSEGLTLAQTHENGDIREIYLRMYLGLANVYIRRGEYSKAIEMDEEIILKSSSYNFPYGLICANSNLGTIYFVQGDYEKSLYFSELGLKYAREHNEWHRISISLNNIGGVFWHQGDLDGAKNYYEESLAIRRKLHDQRGIASTLNNLGAIAAMQEDFSLANTHWQEGLHIAQQLGVKNLIVHILNNLGSVNRDLKQFVNSKDYFERCLALAREINNPRLIADTLCNIAFLHIALIDMDTARKSATEAIKIAHNAGVKPQLLWAMVAIARLHYLNGEINESAHLLGTISADPLHSSANVKDEYESLKADLVARLTDEVFQPQVDLGRQKNLDEIVSSLIIKP